MWSSEPHTPSPVHDDHREESPQGLGYALPSVNQVHASSPVEVEDRTLSEDDDKEDESTPVRKNRLRRSETMFFGELDTPSATSYAEARRTYLAPSRSLSPVASTSQLPQLHGETEVRSWYHTLDEADIVYAPPPAEPEWDGTSFFEPTRLTTENLGKDALGQHPGLRKVFNELAAEGQRRPAPTYSIERLEEPDDEYSDGEEQEEEVEERGLGLGLPAVDMLNAQTTHNNVDPIQNAAGLYPPHNYPIKDMHAVLLERRGNMQDALVSAQSEAKDALATCTLLKAELEQEKKAVKAMMADIRAVVGDEAMAVFLSKMEEWQKVGGKGWLIPAEHR
jgi:hypothetical protein